MRVAILDAAGVITQIEEITEKGMAEGYRPEGEWIEAGEDWEAGGAVTGGVYSPPVPVVVVPDRVTSRQFKLQLLAPILPAHPDGIIDAVEAWVETQSRAVRIAYANSGTFARNEPMLQAGFNALGFTQEQLDEFYVKADKL